jgi:hypothetical protein
MEMVYLDSQRVAMTEVATITSQHDRRAKSQPFYDWGTAVQLAL